MQLSDVDKNFQKAYKQYPDMNICNIKDKPFKIYGLYEPLSDGPYRRIPEEVAKNTSNNVYFLHTNTSGGRIRFKTDSKYIFLKAELPSVETAPHFPITGTSCFDLYADGRFVKTFIPMGDIHKSYEASIEFEASKLRDIIINFPLYNDVNEVFIGISKDAVLESGNEYAYKTPVVFYGSSITQGGCASHAGNSYQNILSKRLDFDYINLGFSGSALAEDTIVDYIKKLDMSIFFYDYDHNAPSVGHLRNTHYKMYKAIRDENPTLPIVMSTSVSHCFSDDITQERIDVIKETYERAIANGDKNLYFLNGQDILKSYDRDVFTVEGIHPNDFGFFCMANAFEKILKNILK